MEFITEARGVSALSFAFTLYTGTIVALTDSDAAAALRGDIARAVGVVIDAAFVVSAVEYSTGTVRVFTARENLNTVGNVFNSTDELMDTVENVAAPVAPQVTPGVSPAARMRELTSARMHSLSNYADGAVSGRAAPHSSDLSLFHDDPATTKRQRRLELTLQAVGIPSIIKPEPANTQLRVSMNIVMRTAAQANAIAASPAFRTNFTNLILSAAILMRANMTRAAAAAAIAALAARSLSGEASYGILDVSSIKVITLLYTKSFWGLVWDWILANLMRVLGLTSALIVFMLMMASAKAFIARRKQRLADALAARRARKALGLPSLGEDGGEIPEHPLLAAARRAPTIAAAQAEALKMKSRLKHLLDPNAHATRTPLTHRALTAWTQSMSQSVTAKNSYFDGGDGEGLNLGYPGGPGASDNPSLPSNDTPRGDAATVVSPWASSRIGGFGGAAASATSFLQSPLSVAKQERPSFGRDAYDLFAAGVNTSPVSPVRPNLNINAGGRLGQGQGRPGEALLTATSSQLIMPTVQVTPKGFRGAGAAVLRARGTY